MPALLLLPSAGSKREDAGQKCRNTQNIVYKYIVFSPYTCGKIPMQEMLVLFCGFEFWI